MNILNLGVTADGGGIVIRSPGNSDINASLMVSDDSGPLLRLTSPNGEDGLYFGTIEIAGVTLENTLEVGGTMRTLRGPDGFARLYVGNVGGGGESLVTISSDASGSGLILRNANGEAISIFGTESFLGIATFDSSGEVTKVFD